MLAEAVLDLSGSDCLARSLVQHGLSGGGVSGGRGLGVEVAALLYTSWELISPKTLSDHFLYYYLLQTGFST